MSSLLLRCFLCTSPAERSYRMRSIIRTFVASLLTATLLALLLLSLAQAVQKQNKPSFLADLSEGMYVARLVTPEGSIKINLPDDMAVGDTISGTVSAEPNGATETEKAQNLSVLNGYVFDLGNGTKV